jgi:hypothetical protein
VTEVKHPRLLAVAVAAQLAKMVKAAGDRARLAAAEDLDDGESVTLRSPSGAKLGKALRTDPENVATVTNAAELHAWIRKHYPDQVRTTEEPSPDTAAVLAVLRRHAPGLIVRTSRIADRMVPDVLAASAAAGEPAGPDGELDVPGVTVVKPPGVLTMRLDPKTAPAAIAEMWAAGQIQLDGSTVRLALPSGGAE